LADRHSFDIVQIQWPRSEQLQYDEILG
jgi:hypothetical protein